MEIIFTRVYDTIAENEKRIFFAIGGAGSSKCLEPGTEIVMADGSLRKIEDVNPGDKVMGIDSTPRTVIEVHAGTGKVYTVKQSKGLNYVVNEDHLLTLTKSIVAQRPYGGHIKGRYPQDGGKINISVKDYCKKSKRWRRYFYGYRVAIDFFERKVEIDPYFLGLWLGDGHKHTTSITTVDKEIKEYIYGFAESVGMGVSVARKKENKAADYRITNGNCKGQGRKKNPLLTKFRKYNLIFNKHIPDDYLYNNRENRLLLLAGIIDTDGCLNTNGFTIVQKNKRLADQIYYLAASLGFRCSLIPRICEIKKLNFSGTYYSIAIYGETENIPTRIERKKAKETKKRTNPFISGISVEYKGIGKYCGFSLDGDGLFLLKDFTVIHNSHSIAQWLIFERMLKPNHRILVTRKTTPSLRLSCYLLIKDLLAQYAIPYNENRSEMTIKVGSSLMVFKGLDDPEKIKSFDVDTVWAEEATELNIADYRRLNLSTRWSRAKAPYRIIYSLNPISRLHWIKTKVLDVATEDVGYDISTYIDNPFLAPEYVASLEDLKNQDINYYRIYALGEWGLLEGLIYSNWDTKILDGTPDDVYYGLDFGFNNPTALIETAVKDQELYLTERIYQTHLTTPELISAMDDQGINKRALITADSEDPKTIEEIFQAGYNIHPAAKGPDSVRRGIDLLKRRKIHIHPASVNLKKEFQSYKWKQDRNGNTLDEPVKFNNHGVDSVRYAEEGYTGCVKPSEADDEILIEQEGYYV